MISFKAPLSRSWPFVSIATGDTTEAQQATTLLIGLQNVVEYQVDTSDLSKWGTNPNITKGGIAQGMGVGCAGVPVVVYGDIVSVNGDPARGTYVARAVSVCLSPTPRAGLNAIADISGNSLRDETYYILQSDGVTPIGTIMVNGLNGNVTPPPGPPPGGQNFTIVGGTGAFLGARGQKGSGNGGGIIGNRTASITEDPANRRQNGGGHGFFTFYVIPMFRPEVVITPNADAHGKHLDLILRAAVHSKYYGFSRGYVGRLLSISPGQSDRVNTWLDRLEAESPEMAHYLALSAPSVAGPFERTMRLISISKLPVQALHSFLAGNLLDRMTSVDLALTLDTLLRAGDTQSLHIAVDFIGHGMRKGRIDTSPEIQSVMWKVLRASATVNDRAGFWWADAVQTFMELEPEQACEVAILGLMGEEYEKRTRAWGILILLAKEHPELVMSKIGRTLLDPERGWTLRTTSRSSLFNSIPFEVVRNWLSTTELQGARVIASHLQPPFVDGQGKPQVPALTEYVLARWGDDDDVFGRFWASTHHLQMYSGDIAGEHKREADRGRAFLTHPLLAIRKWAENEVAVGEEQARQWTLRMEELSL